MHFDRQSEFRLRPRAALIFAFAALAVVGIVAAVGYGLATSQPWKRRAETPPPREPTAAPRRPSSREVSRAFRDDAPPPSQEELAEFTYLFNDLARVIARQDAQGFLWHCDVPALVEQINAQSPGRTFSEYDGTEVAETIVSRFGHNAAGAGEAEFEIRRIRRYDQTSKPLGGELATEALVYTRRKVFNWERTARQCWWLRREYNGWKVYDVADLTLGLRASTMIAECSRAGVSHETLEALMSCLPHLVAGAYADAGSALETVQDAQLPTVLEAYRHYLIGVKQVLEWNLDEADQALSRAEVLQPKMPALAAARAALSFRRGEHEEEALAQADRFIRAVGPDATILYVRGEALVALHRKEEAESAFRRALEDDPYALDSLAALAELLPDEGTGEIRALFERIPDTETWYAQLAERLCARREWSDLETVTEVMREIAPRDPNINYYSGQAKYAQEKYAEAAEHFAEAFIVVESEDDQRFYIDSYLECMLALDQPVEAYHRAPLSRYAFRQIAFRLTEPMKSEDPLRLTRRLEHLREVIDLHRDREADDPWLTYYEAELLVIERKYDEAERIYASAMDAQRDDAMREEFRSARVLALHKASRDIFAYENVSPESATFSQLADLCWGDTQFDRLEELLDRHRAAAPHDPELLCWDGLMAKNRKEYQAAIEALRAYLETSEEDDDTTEIEFASAAGLSSSFFERLIASKALLECYIETSQWDAALALVAEEGGLTRLEHGLLIYLAQGDLTKAESALQRFVAEGGELAWLYADERIGGLLRGDAAAPLRAKYPEPPADDEDAP